MHNGMIGDWQINRRDIESMISKDFYHLRHGTTDSEALFLLALSEGLEDDPILGMSRAVGKVVEVMKRNGSINPLRISAALSDGQSIWAYRFSSDKQSPSLYYGIPDTHTHLDGNSVSTIASEPFDDGEDGNWAGVCEDSVLHWMNGRVSLHSFNPG
jgi:glutamine amidotransferase